MSLPFVVTQEYPIYQDKDGTLAFQIKNVSEDNLLLKVLTAKSMQDAVKMNQVIFALPRGEMTRVFATYKQPCPERNPKLLFQAIKTGDNDPVMFESVIEVRKNAWNQNIDAQKAHGNYYEYQFSIGFLQPDVNQQYIQINGQNASLQLNEKLNTLRDCNLKLEQQIDKLQSEIHTNIKILNKEEVQVGELQNKIAEMRYGSKQSIFIGDISYTKVFSLGSIMVGFFTGIFLKFKLK